MSDERHTLQKARTMRLGLEALAVDPSFEPIGPRSVIHSDKATEREIEQSKAISLKRIADRLDSLDLGGLRNQLLDIAYQAGVNFRGHA